MLKMTLIGKIVNKVCSSGILTIEVSNPLKNTHFVEVWLSGVTAENVAKYATIGSEISVKGSIVNIGSHDKKKFRMIGTKVFFM